MKIVAVIPCHNEGKTIGDIIQRVRKYVTEVIVVDNLSSDDTVKQAKGAKVVHCSIKGAGISTQMGVNTALRVYQADIIVTLDGDGQHLPEEIPLLLIPIENNEADFTIGERQFSTQNSPLVRRLSVAFTTWLYNVGWDDNLSEAQCGFRAFTSKAAQSFYITDPKFGFSVETLIKARAKGIRMKGVPVSCIYHGERASLQHIPVLWSLIKWRWICDRTIMFKRLGYKIFTGITNPFLGLGFGRIPYANNIYRFAMRNTLEHTSKIVKINGYQLAVTINKETPIDGISRKLICDNEYEPFTTSVISKCVTQNMNVVDVGANIGYYTLLMSQRVGEAGRVWAFEPERRNYKALAENCRLNHLKNVSIQELAVDKCPGTVPFYVSGEESGEHSLVKARKHTKEIPITAISLDSFFCGKVPIHFMKIDTEGNDANVLLGADGLIKKYAPSIVTEFWIEGLEKSGWRINEYWQYLRARYKNIYLLDDFKREITPTGQAEVIKYCSKHRGYSANLLCAVKEAIFD